MLSRDETAGLLCLTGGVALFSTIEIAAKFIGGRADPVVLTCLRFFVTGIVLLAAAWPALRLRRVPLGWADVRVFMLVGLVGVALAIPLFHVAILRLDKAASAAVVFSVNPVFALVFARFINREPWTSRKWGAVFLGVAGVLCFVFEAGQPAWLSGSGLALMVLSALLFALSLSLAKKYIARYGALLLMGGAALSGSLMLAPFALWQLARNGGAGLADAWLPVAYITLLGTALAYFLYYYGLMNASVSRGAMTFFLKPVLASALAVWIRREHFNGWMAAGTALILCGLLVAMSGRPADARDAVLKE